MHACVIFVLIDRHCVWQDKNLDFFPCAANDYKSVVNDDDTYTAITCRCDQDFSSQERKWSKRVVVLSTKVDNNFAISDLVRQMQCLYIRKNYHRTSYLAPFLQMCMRPFTAIKVLCLAK